MLNRQKAIQDAAEASLRNIIGKNGGNKEGEIFSQLIYLTEKVETFGEERMYISLPVKEALVRMLDADAQYSYDLKQSNDGQALTATCFLKWSGNESYSGIGTCTRYLHSIFRFDSLTEEERKEKWVKTCKSLARADAIRDALALSAFDFDESDLQIADEEKKVLEKELEKAVPEIPSPEEKKARRRTSKEAASEKVEEKLVLPEELPVIPEEAEIRKTEIVTETNEEPESENSSELSYEKALTFSATKGNYAGISLKDILETNPKHLVWLMNNDTGADGSSKAARTIVENTPELRALVS